jgi:hypothetical protein
MFIAFASHLMFVLRTCVWKMEMRFTTWSARSLHKAGSLETSATDVGKYKLDSVPVQVLR